MAPESNNTKQALMAKDISQIRGDLAEIKEDIKQLKGEFVTRNEFMPIKQIVYGAVALILVAVIGGLLNLVLRS
jgi:thiosulfate reductase cytochrome b subunit